MQIRLTDTETWNRVSALKSSDTDTLPDPDTETWNSGLLKTTATVFIIQH